MDATPACQTKDMQFFFDQPENQWDSARPHRSETVKSQASLAINIFGPCIGHLFSSDHRQSRWCTTLTFDFDFAPACPKAAPFGTLTSGAKPYKIITQLYPQRSILCEHSPNTQLLKSRVCHQFACPILPWVPPFSCAIRIPKRHSFVPPVREAELRDFLVTSQVKSSQVKSSQVKSKLAGPKAAPLGRKQMECKIFDHLLCKVKKKQNPVSSTSNVHVQQPPQSNCQSLSRSSIFAVLFPKCRPVARVSVVLSCSIRESCGSTVREAKLQHRMQISTLLLCMWQTKVSAQRGLTASALCCSIHARFRAMVMPNWCQ